MFQEHLLVHVRAEKAFMNTKHADYLRNVTNQQLPGLPGAGGASSESARTPTLRMVQVTTELCVCVFVSSFLFVVYMNMHNAIMTSCSSCILLVYCC